MATTNSGSRKEVAIGDDVMNPTYVVLTGPGTGFDAFDGFGPVEGTTRTTSGGLTSSRKSGHSVNGGSFSMDETANARAELLGRNGRRCKIRYRPNGTAAGRAQQVFSAILTITHSAPARADRRFDVTVAVDGDVTDSTQ